MKYFAILAFLAIIASLGSALFFMMRDGQDGKGPEQDEPERERPLDLATAAARRPRGGRERRSDHATSSRRAATGVVRG